MSNRSLRLLLSLALFTQSSIAVATADQSSREQSIGKQVAELFQMGFVRGPRAIQDSQRIYDSLRRESADDPRIEYAYGLVLLRQLKNKEAQEQFLAAAKQTGNLYRPAWRALIWTHFLTAKEYDLGFDRILEFTRRIKNFEEFSDDIRKDEIYWIGRVMSAVELLIVSPQSRESWMQTEEKLIGLIGAEFVDDYNEGKEDVHVHHALIEDEIRHARETLKAKQSEQIAMNLERSGKVLKDAESKKASLKKSAEDAKENLEERSLAFKKQMQRLERDSAFLERRSMTLVNMMLALDQQINVVRSRGSNRTGTANNNTANTDQAIAALQGQRLIYETEFQRITVLAQETTLNAQRLNEQRAEYLDQHQKATGDLVERDAAVEKFKEKTLKKVAELKKAEANVTIPKSVDKLISSRSFRSYVELDPFAERDKVLNSFGVKAIAK